MRMCAKCTCGVVECHVRFVCCCVAMCASECGCHEHWGTMCACLLWLLCVCLCGVTCMLGGDAPLARAAPPPPIAVGGGQVANQQYGPEAKGCVQWECCCQNWS